MTQVTISLALCVVLTIATAVLCRKQQPPRLEGERLRVRAVPETGLMAGMLLAVGVALDVVKLVLPETAGTDPGSYTFIAVFALVCVGAGCHILLSVLVKQVVAYDDRFEAYDPFGGSRTVYWRQVTQVKSQLLSKAVTFQAPAAAVSVNGRNKEYLAFLDLALERVPRETGSDELGRLRQRYAGMG